MRRGCVACMSLAASRRASGAHWTTGRGGQSDVRLSFASYVHETFALSIAVRVRLQRCCVDGNGRSDAGGDRSDPLRRARQRGSELPIPRNRHEPRASRLRRGGIFLLRHGEPVQRPIATGVSQSATRLAVYVNAIHPRDPILDGAQPMITGHGAATRMATGPPQACCATWQRRERSSARPIHSHR